MKTLKEHSKLGKVSLIFSVISIFGAYLTFIIRSLLINLSNDISAGGIPCIEALIIVVTFFILGILAVILGLLAKKKDKDKFGLIAIILGVISLIINFICFLVVSFVCTVP